MIKIVISTSNENKKNRLTITKDEIRLKFTSETNEEHQNRIIKLVNLISENIDLEILEHTLRGRLEYLKDVWYINLYRNRKYRVITYAEIRDSFGIVNRNYHGVNNG